MTDKLITCMVSRVKIYSQSRCQSSSLKPFIKDAIRRNLSHHCSERNGTNGARREKRGVTGKDGTRVFFPTLCVLQDTPLSIGKTPFGWWKKIAVLPSARYFSVGETSSLFIQKQQA